MKAKTRVLIKTRVLSAGAMLAMLAFGPYASATTVRINFSGTLTSPDANTSTSFNGYADLQIGPDPLASSTFPTPTRTADPIVPPATTPTGTTSLAPGTPRVDPANAQVIGSGTTGMFNGVAITGVLPIAAQTDPNLNEYVPASRTNLIVANTPDGAPVVTYDDLFYADGSPLTCLWYYPDGTTAAKYPFAGGYFDIYGVLFELGDGSLVDLWSNGAMPGLGLNYGAILFAPAAEDYAVLASQFNGVMVRVPEPDFLWLFGAAVLGLFAWRRSKETRKQALQRVDRRGDFRS